MVNDFHSVAAATAAADEFERVFARKERPADLPELIIVGETERQLRDLMVEAGLATSKSEAKRKIEQGGVKIDGERVSDPFYAVSAVRHVEFVLQVGRRGVRVRRAAH